jgi:hypothetical protein
MPTSLPEGKDWIAEHVRKLNPMIVLDLGVGMGTYSHLLKPILDPVCVFIGFEIYEPYVAKYNLHMHYHAVLVEDVRCIKTFPDADVVILGDIIEHMSYTDAVRLVEKSRRAARKAVFLSLPIVEWPQGALDGNEHEAHMRTWDHSMVMNLENVLDYQVGSAVGVYMFSSSAGDD